jgi:hypothetical protein
MDGLHARRSDIDKPLLRVVPIDREADRSTERHAEMCFPYGTAMRNVTTGKCFQE